MELDEFRADFMNRVAIQATSDSNFSHAAFVDVAIQSLEDAGEVADFEPCYYRGSSGRYRKNIGVDGYAFDKADASLRVFIAQPTFAVTSTLIQTEARAAFERLRAFIDEAISGKLDDVIDINSPARALADEIYKVRAHLARIRAYLLTDAMLSARIKDWPEGAVDSIPVEFHIWDISRFHRVESSCTGQDELVVDFARGKHGIPCLEASTVDSPYSAYLCVLDGSLLADIYDEYGSRLLEGNVRSFLSAKGRVNKGIRNTVQHFPEMFFAYNNGIAATASDVLIERSSEGLRLLSASDLQIVNGAQTTASIAAARRGDKAALDRIFVPMKLSVIEPASSGEMIPQISRFANSQNKVSDADFFSNHDYHRRLEQISRRIWAPAKPGAQHETRWFYERARGQFLNEPVAFTDAKKRRFIEENPRDQVLVKTDLAKSELSWEQKPQRVSRGAQSAFVYFADDIAARWDADANAFNESYFRDAVARIIAFRATEKVVSAQSWYLGGYRANLVTYAIAKLAYCVARLPDRMVDFGLIWQRQSISEAFACEIARIAQVAFGVITDPPAGRQNVTQWCKRDECWERLKQVEVLLDVPFVTELISIQELRPQRREARTQQIVDSGIDAQSTVVQFGADYWAMVLSWATKRNIVAPLDETILRMAAGFRGGVPNDKQSKRLLELQKRLEAEGLPPARLSVSDS